MSPIARFGGTLLLLACAGALPADEPAGPAAATPADLIKKTEANAEAFAEGEQLDADAEAAIKAIRYDETSLPALTEALGQSRPIEQRLYLGIHLLPGLLRSDPAICQRAATTVRAFRQRLGRHRPLPTYSKRRLDVLTMSESGRTTPENLLEQIEEMERLRDKKLRLDRAVADHNRMLSEVELLVCRVLLRAGQPGTDADAAALAVAAERDRLTTFADILEAIRAAAADMAPERAAKLLPAIARTGEALRMAKKEYVDPAEAKLSLTNNSTFDVREVCPGVHFLQTANALARRAGTSAHDVPGTKEVDAAAALREAKALINSRNTKNQTKGFRSLRQVIQRHRGTEAAKQAQAFLDSAEGMLAEAKLLLSAKRKKHVRQAAQLAKKIIKEYPRSAEARVAKRVLARAEHLAKTLKH
jgi:hypothetical protein